MQRFKITFAFLLAIGLQLNSQETDTTNTKTETKTGWNVGVLPALGFDSNLGLQYGAIANLFYYGNGERYPDYNHSLYLQLSSFTKGGVDAIMFFDSYTLIPEKHLIARASYTRNRAYPFYGFNGNETVYDPHFYDNKEQDFMTEVYYKYDRGLLKTDLILQDKIGESNFHWMAGLDMGYYSTSSVDIEHLNKGKDSEDEIKDTLNLYDQYVNWGIIEDDESEGGFDNSIKLGLVYDTRDRITNPMHGTWTELITRTAPSFAGNDDNFFRLSLIHRQYFTLIEEKFSFAYRVWYEAAFGKVPFYSRPYLTSSNYFEGMGGAYTLRGVLMNRVVGRQTGITNVELRYKLKRFQFIGQNFYVGAIAFTDLGYILEPYDLEMSNVSSLERERFFSDEGQKPAISAGMGLKLVMNENFVLSADYANCFDEDFGSSGMYVLIGYLF